MPSNTEVLPSTRQYSKFKLLSTNREVNMSHVRSLMKEFEDFGNITQVSPVLVTPRMEVIDGQHRLEAAKQLGLPVYYKQVEHLSIKDARRMNIAQKSWRSQDYLMSYVNEGRKPYQKLLMLVNDYAEYRFGYTTIQLYALGSYYGAKGYNALFRSGDFPDFDLGVARERLDRLSELVDLNPDFAIKSLAVALLDIMASEHYDHQRMVHKVSKAPNEVRAYANVVDNKRMLENLYNADAKANRVRLF